MNLLSFLSPTGSSDPYNTQFTRTLKIIEKDKSNGWEPEVPAKKVVKIVECKNPCQRYIIASFEQKLAVLLMKILPGKWFRMILEDHYKIR